MRGGCAAGCLKRLLMLKSGDSAISPAPEACREADPLLKGRGGERIERGGDLKSDCGDYCLELTPSLTESTASALKRLFYEGFM